MNSNPQACIPINSFQEALYLGDIPSISDYIYSNIVNLNKWTTFFGASALIVAIEENNEELVKYLLDNGANIEYKWRYKEDITPLELACKLGYFSIVNILLNYGANPNNNSEYANPLFQTLFWAISENSNFDYLSCVKLLLDHGTNVNVQIGCNITPLIWATTFGKTELVKLLLCYGASIDMVDSNNRDALYYAKNEKFLDIVEVLELFKDDCIFYSLDCISKNNLSPTSVVDIVNLFC